MQATERQKILLCAIAKNEGPYLAEWAAYHRLVGFDQIVVYDNDSEDDSREVLESLRVQGVLDWKPWPNTGDGRVQKAAYADCLKQRRSAFEWIAFLDIDEFLYIPKFDNLIHAFLEAYDHLDAIGVNWSLFGTSGHASRTDGLVIERFTRAAETQHSGNRAIKTIAKTDSLVTPNLHNHAFGDGVVYQTVAGDVIPAGVGKSGRVSHDVIRVNHYFTKSEEEWQLKVSRGRATKPDGHPDKLRTQDHFDRHNRNEVLSLDLAAYVEPVLTELKRLGLDRPKAPARQAGGDVRRGLADGGKSSGKTSFSQYAEDLIVESLLRRSKIGLRERGSYIDIGAGWPMKYSNSFAFYRRGWSGVCVDPTPGFSEAFEAVRPRDVCLNVGVSAEEGTQTLYAFENPVFNSFDKERSEKLGAIKTKGRTIVGAHQVDMRTLQSIVDEHFGSRDVIDFASVDVGGREADVLMSLDFQKVQPHVLVVGAKFKSLEDGLKLAFAKRLKAAGYRYVAAVDQTMFFAL